MKCFRAAFTACALYAVLTSSAWSSQAAAQPASCHDDGPTASVKDAPLPDAPSVALQDAKKTDAQADAQKAGAQKKTPGKPDPNASIDGPYKGHFLYLVPAYHVQELTQPFKPLTVGEKFHIFAHDTFDQQSLAQALFNAGIDEATGTYKGYGG